MKKIGIILLLAILSLLHINCGYSGCGGPYHYNPSPGVEILLGYNYENDNSIKIKLIEPKVYYQMGSKTKLPLLINFNRMVFEISKQDTVLDSLFIEYNMEVVYYDGGGCIDEGYHAKVKIQSCYTTGRNFPISYYFPINTFN